FFFSGLKDEHHCSCPFRSKPVPRDTGTEHHGGVRIVATGMHHAVVLRSMFPIGHLFDRRRIKIGAQSETEIAFRSRSMHERGHACSFSFRREFADPRSEFDAFLHKHFRHERSSTMFVEGKFRVLVQVAAPLHHLWSQGCYGFPKFFDHLPKMSFSAAKSITTPKMRFTVSAGRASAHLLPK